MNHEKIPDPTADQAIAKADRQRRLEEKHGIKVGETIYITETTMEGEHGKKTVRKIKVKVAGVYKHHVRLLFPGGYYRAKRQLERLNEELLELKWEKRYPAVIQDGMPHGSGGGDLSGYAARMDELERKIIKARYKRIQILKEIRDHIERMEDENEKDVLVYRYIRNMKWEDIAVKMNYRRQHVLRIHGKALINFKM